MQSADQDIMARFLRRESEAVKVIEGWIARAASPFRQRLAAQWEDVLQEVCLEVTRLFERGAFRGEASLKTYLCCEAWPVRGRTCADLRSAAGWPGVWLRRFSSKTLAASAFSSALVSSRGQR